MSREGERGTGDGGRGKKSATLKFFPIDINNRNQTLYDVRYTFDEFIC